MHWLQIDVSNLAGKPGSTRKLAASGPVEGFRSGLGWVEDGDPVYIDLLLTSTRDGIEVSGEARCRLHLSCSRCLVEYEQDFRVSLDEKFYLEPGLAEEYEGYEVRDQVIDLEPMLRDVIVLDIPITPVHAEDCKGLCPECGADLNVSDCRHAERAVDARWAPLQSLMALQSGGEEEEVEK
ncbi:MAG TPA: DUF177 domain-containing protein [Actinomycetota bacterium]|nr:DUF177 domain-containing protein [Actinomycetota bacterium]